MVVFVPDTQLLPFSFPRPRDCFLDYVPVVGVQECPQVNKRGQAAGHFGHIADFVRRQSPAEERLFAVRQPFLDDLVAADGVVPNGLGYIPPTGDIVEEYVAGPVPRPGRRRSPARWPLNAGPPPCRSSIVRSGFRPFFPSCSLSAQYHLSAWSGVANLFLYLQLWTELRSQSNSPSLIRRMISPASRQVNEAAEGTPAGGEDRLSERVFDTARKLVSRYRNRYN
jgi:hypothetical protein